MTQITPQPGIMDIELYVGGASAVAGVADVVKLSSNENPLGPSPAAVEAFKAVASSLHIYPSSDHASLRNALGEVHGLEADRIICCAGSGDVLNLLCQAYAGPGDEVIHTEHGFALYRIYALAAGATPVEVAERDRVTDVDAILAACTPATRLVFIANPNNPTGTMIDTAQMARLAEGLPERCLLVIDGAYGEFVEGYDSGAALAQSRENVVMTRTFSKLYGLGGLRIGWGYGPRAIIDVLNRIRGPFNLSAAALAAAEVSVRDHAYADQCRAQNAKWRDWMIAQLDHMGVPCDASSANFILPRFETAAQAEGCDAHLQSLGLIVRRVGGYNLPHCLRITVGDEAACRRVIAGMRAFLEDL